jgi:hypothetical protein
MNRRDFLTGAGALVTLGPSLGGTALATPSIGSVGLRLPVVDKPVKPDRAASLKRLLAEAKTGARPRFAMTRIDGYVSEKDDVILWGRNEPGRPELIFDDLVIAVRSVRGRYGKETPGVGLDYRRDLRPGMIAERGSEDLKRFEALHAAQAKSLEAFKAACMQRPYYTYVLGLPRDSEMSKRLLDADYLLKKATQGTNELKIQDQLLNPIGTWNLAYAKVLDGKASQFEKDAVDVPRHSFGTLTFKPGRMSYIRDENSVFIDCVQIVLESKNWKDGTNEVVENPIYRDFAYTWTNRMDEIIPTEPDLMRMQGIFRLFALARILNQNNEFTHLNDRQVVADYLVPMVSVPDHYDPKITVNHVPSKKRPYTYRMCGGVRVIYQNTQQSPDLVTDATRNDINLAGRKAIDAMKSCTGSCWNVE